jgi:hypothetical protein
MNLFLPSRPCLIRRLLKTYRRCKWQRKQRQRAKLSTSWFFDFLLFVRLHRKLFLCWLLEIQFKTALALDWLSYLHGKKSWCFQRSLFTFLVNIDSDFVWQSVGGAIRGRSNESPPGVKSCENVAVFLLPGDVTLRFKGSRFQLFLFICHQNKFRRTNLFLEAGNLRNCYTSPVSSTNTECYRLNEGPFHVYKQSSEVSRFLLIVS